MVAAYPFFMERYNYYYCEESYFLEPLFLRGRGRGGERKKERKKRELKKDMNSD
jgi:hypothetical protein